MKWAYLDSNARFVAVNNNAALLSLRELTSCAAGMLRCELWAARRLRQSGDWRSQGIRGTGKFGKWSKV